MRSLIQAIVIDLGSVLLQIVDWRKWECLLQLPGGELSRLQISLKRHLGAPLLLCLCRSEAVRVEWSAMG
ncbi:hypothetical protein EI42_02162 [Thermosporothrix hazakensis]|jgi:hypothetical protein|uniref:Uncharacterized protein n=1 Tax=Thermosporothrix hazakensis TaxID=644383 RepID=A0A326UM73_THEHA|nr:hypothetical protein EI42_02162 [Thermosporothrix hazakensis]